MLSIIMLWIKAIVAQFTDIDYCILRVWQQICSTIFPLLDTAFNF